MPTFRLFSITMIFEYQKVTCVNQKVINMVCIYFFVIQHKMLECKVVISGEGKGFVRSNSLKLSNVLYALQFFTLFLHLLLIRI